MFAERIEETPLDFIEFLTVTQGKGAFIDNHPAAQFRKIDIFFQGFGSHCEYFFKRCHKNYSGKNYFYSVFFLSAGYSYGTTIFTTYP